MTPAARIAAVIELLDEIIGQPKPADGIMSAYFRARKYIGSKDRAAIAGASYQTLRRFLRLQWHLVRAGAALSGRNLTLAELVLAENFSIQRIEEVFSGQQYAPGKLTKEERKILSFLTCHPSESWGPDVGRTWMPASAGMTRLEVVEMPQHIKLECPEEYVEKFRAAFGENFEAEMRGMMTEAALDLRVNPRVVTREAAIAELKQNGIQAAATKFSPFGIRVVGRPALPTLDLFKRGGVEIQDEGSQLIALLVDAKPGEAVVDFCAGAGGKTLAIAAMMQNKGRVIACDVLGKRLERSRVRFTRAGLDNIQTRPLTSENDKWVKRSAGTFDRVLVDAPCSGTGVWRRNPDARWKHLGPGLNELLPLQYSILKSAARLVKPGGRLVYATCSLLPDENQMQVEKFLVEHAEFQLVPIAIAIGECATFAAGECDSVLSKLSSIGTPGKNAVSHSPASLDYMTLSPARHETDGFFAAVMTRKT